MGIRSLVVVELLAREVYTMGLDGIVVAIVQCAEEPSMTASSTRSHGETWFVISRSGSALLLKRGGSRHSQGIE